MSSPRFSLLGLLGGVFLVGLACAAPVDTAHAPGNPPSRYWWSSVAVAVTALILGLCLLGAAPSHGQARCALTGAALAGGIYWLLVLSTWFSGSVGNRLFTTRVIAWTERKAYAWQRPALSSPFVATTIHSGPEGAATTLCGPSVNASFAGWLGAVPGALGSGAIPLGKMLVEPVYTASGSFYALIRAPAPSLPGASSPASAPAR